MHRLGSPVLASVYDGISEDDEEEESEEENNEKEVE
jgi:hypothetical protein